MLNAFRSTIYLLLLFVSGCSTSAQQYGPRPPAGRDIAEVYNCGFSLEDARNETAAPEPLARIFIIAPRMRLWVIEGASQWASTGRELELKNACHRQGLINLFGPSCSLSSTRFRYFQREHFLATGETEIRVNPRTGHMHYRERYSGLFGVRRNSDYERQCRVVGHVRLRRLEDDAVRIIDRYPINQRSEIRSLSD